jgi:hypothetical protein
VSRFCILMRRIAPLLQLATSPILNHACPYSSHQGHHPEALNEVIQCRPGKSMHQQLMDVETAREVAR